MRSARRIASLVLLCCAALLASPPPPDAATGAESIVEVSPAAAALLRFVNSAQERSLAVAPGFNPIMAARVVAHIKSGKTLHNLVELTRVAGMRPQDLEKALEPYQQAEDRKSVEASRKPVPDPPAAGKAAGKSKAGASPAGPAAAAPEPTAEGPIGAVRPGFFGKLPGYDELDTIDPLKKQEFLETVNRETCTCGCKNETLAFCLVNDPGCPIVKARVRKIYDDILTKPAR